jgi:hypothetical protein
MVLVNFQSFSVSSTTEGWRGGGHQFNTVPRLRIRGDYLHELCNFLLRGTATKDLQLHVLDVQVFSRCRRFIRGQNASALFRSLTGIQEPPGYGHRNENIHCYGLLTTLCDKSQQICEERRSKLKINRRQNGDVEHVPYLGPRNIRRHGTKLRRLGPPGTADLPGVCV